MRRILVTGATGNIGGEVLRQLPSTGLQIRVLVRNPKGVLMPANVEVASGDLTDPESLVTCLDGVDTVFLVWAASIEAVRPALAHIANRTRRVVFLSAPLKTAHPLFQQPNPSRSRAEVIERLIETSGLDWTFLRPGMFALNSIRWWAPQIRTGGLVRWPYLDVPTAPIDQRDIAAVAVRLLCEETHSRAEYVLTGPESLSQLEQITIIGSVLGRSLAGKDIPAEVWLNELPANLPTSAAKYLLDAWAAARHRPAFVTQTVAELTGSPARTFRQWATDYVAQFRS